MLTTFLILLASFLSPQDKQQPKADPTLAIKQFLVEADKRYKAAIKDFRQAKADADQDETVEKHFDSFLEWITSLDGLEVSFDSKVTNVTKHPASGTLSAFATPPKEMQAFGIDAHKPILARQTCKFEIDEEQRKELVLGTNIRITAKLRITPLDRYFGINAEPAQAVATFMVAHTDSKAFTGNVQIRFHPRYPAIGIAIEDITYELKQNKANK
jgi:hypothetical protein